MPKSRVVDRRRRPHLLEEPLHQRLIARQVGQQDLHRHLPDAAILAGRIHHAHPAVLRQRDRGAGVGSPAAAAAGVYFLATFIFGEMGLVKYYRMKQQYDSLQEETGRLKEENVRLLRDVRALKSDPSLIEQIARDKLGLARPGEIVYYYRQQEP